MKLQSLEISRGWRGENPLTGTVKFTTEDGNIELNLRDEDCAAIVQHCADAIVTASKRVAQNLTTAAMQTTAIEHQS